MIFLYGHLHIIWKPKNVQICDSIFLNIIEHTYV